MAASITNSNETLDSITTGLLIHEVGFFLPLPPPTPTNLLPQALALSLRGLCFHMPSSLILDRFCAFARLLRSFHCHI